jgi:hypothetical protein
MILSAKPKNSSLNGSDCIAYALTGMNGLLANLITNTPAPSSPITVQPGCRNVNISNITDYINDGSTGTPAAMITFTGNAGTCNNISVSGIKTQRNMFARLIAVTDLTVDYTRQLRVNITGGVASKTDPHELLSSISSVTVSSNSVTIVFSGHVTQKAIEDCRVTPNNAAQLIVSSTTNKTLVINTYTIAGAALNPQSTNIGITVVLNS